MERNLDKAIALGSEYLYKTCLTGPKAEEAFARVLSQQKLNMEQQFIRQGNQYAAVRAAAHYSVEYALSERCSGVTGTTSCAACWNGPTGPPWAKSWKRCGKRC